MLWPKRHERTLVTFTFTEICLSRQRGFTMQSVVYSVQKDRRKAREELAEGQESHGNTGKTSYEKYAKLGRVDPNSLTKLFLTLIRLLFLHLENQN